MLFGIDTVTVSMWVSAGTGIAVVVPFSGKMLMFAWRRVGVIETATLDFEEMGSMPFRHRYRFHATLNNDRFSFKAAPASLLVLMIRRNQSRLAGTSTR